MSPLYLDQSSPVMHTQHLICSITSNSSRSINK